ncbi:hypothetical protein NPIL_658691, partial [Nephila pilipes]
TWIILFFVETMKLQVMYIRKDICMFLLHLSSTSHQLYLKFRIPGLLYLAVSMETEFVPTAQHGYGWLRNNNFIRLVNTAS